MISADEMRDRLGLRSTQALILVLFDEDNILEDMWARGGLLIWQLAAARYDLIVSPSFSTYSPRPRTEFMINTRRSMLYFKALQDAGVPAVARVAWQVTHDARRSLIGLKPIHASRSWPWTGALTGASGTGATSWKGSQSSTNGRVAA